MIKSQLHPIEDTVRSAASYLQHLAPGNLAELRRMGPMSIAPPTYWRLAARHSHTIGNNHDVWQSILRTLAMLTLSGDPEKRKPLDNPKKTIGPSALRWGQSRMAGVWRSYSTCGQRTPACATYVGPRKAAPNAF